MSDATDDESLSDREGRLLAGLRAALGPDPVPAGLIGRAEGLIAFIDADRELVQLLEEGAAELVGTRGAVASQTVLEFELADSSVSVEVTPDRDRLSGQVLSGALSEVTLERLDGAAERCEVDELGRFSFQHAVAGPARLRLLGGSATPLVTDWFLL